MKAELAEGAVLVAPLFFGVLAHGIVGHQVVTLAGYRLGMRATAR